MVQRKRGLCLKKKKGSTRNKKQAAKRDANAARAAAAEAELAATAEVRPEADLDEMEEEAEVEEEHVKQPRPNTPEEEEQRRQAIVFHYKKLHSPPESMWDGPGGTVAKIADAIKLGKGKDRRPIRRTLERYVAGKPLVTHGGGRTPVLTHGEALVATEILESGFALEQAAYMVTAHRTDKGKGPVSRTAVETGFAGLGGVTRARGTRCQGSTNPQQMCARRWCAYGSGRLRRSASCRTLNAGRRTSSASSRRRGPRSPGRRRLASERVSSSRPLTAH